METANIIALGSLLVAFITLLISARRDTRGEAANQAQLVAKLDSIASGVDDIRVEQRSMRARLDSYAERLARVESSAKSAHHRLDQMTVPYHPPDNMADGYEEHRVKEGNGEHED